MKTAVKTNNKPERKDQPTHDKETRISHLELMIQNQPKNEFGNVIITEKNYKLFLELTNLQKE